jgi:hypothetical protein
MRAPTALLIALTLCLAPAALSEPPLFPILGWWGPPLSPGNLETYKNGGFNTLLVPAGSRLETDLATACSAGLSVYVVGPQRLGPRPAQWRDALEGHACLAGAILHERATASTAPDLADTVGKITDALPGVRPLASLVAPSDEPEWQAMAEALLDAGMPALLFHSFPFLKAGVTDEAEFYGNLRKARALCEQRGAELWGMVQTTAHGPYRRASESDMRLHAYSYLAAGARALTYFTYWGPPKEERDAPGGAYAGWGRPMVRPSNGEPLYGWLKARDLNAEVQTLAPHLLRLEPQGMYFVRDVPAGCAPLPREGRPIEEVQAERALVAFLDGPGGAEWALLVNRRHGPKQSALGQKTTMRVFVRPGIERAVEIDRYNGFEKPIPIENRSFLITIPAGTGSLIRLGD